MTHQTTEKQHRCRSELIFICWNHTIKPWPALQSKVPPTACSICCLAGWCLHGCNTGCNTVTSWSSSRQLSDKKEQVLPGWSSLLGLVLPYCGFLEEEFACCFSIARKKAGYTSTFSCFFQTPCLNHSVDFSLFISQSLFQFLFTLNATECSSWMHSIYRTYNL